MRRAGGFTLMEMMIVITLIGILAGMALNSFRYLSATTRIKGAGTDLYLALIKARNEAVKRNRLVAIVKNSAGWQAGWQIIADQNSDGTYSPAAPDRLLSDAGAEQNVNITMADNQVVFLASGRILGTAPVFTITSSEDATKKRCVKADLTGKPYVSDPGTGTCS